MKVTILNDDFLNECYGLDREFPDFEIPTEFIGDYDIVAETPIDINHDEESFEQILNSIESNYNNKVEFKDIGYCFEIYRNEGKSRLFTTITNQDFWFNFHKNKSILTIIESEIHLDKYIDILQDKTVKEFFIENLSNEIERLDQLELLKSFRKFVKLQQLFKRFEGDIWCKEILQLYEIISQKISVKIDQFCTEAEYKLMAQIILIKRIDDVQKHLNRIKTLIFKLSYQERQSLFLSIKSLFGLKGNTGNGEIHFFKYVSPGYYCIASTITLYHFEKLINCLSENQSLQISVNSIGKSTFEHVKFSRRISMEQKVFKTELLELVNTTTEENKKFTDDEMEYICLYLTNHKNYNSNRQELDKFNKWLGNDSNRFLFKTYLKFASASSSRIIKSGHFDALANSISKKFQLKGFNKKTLLNYLNAKEPDFKLNNSNKSSFAHIKDQLFRTEKKLQNGTLKKMYREILDKL
ncbi:MAG: hypothetical protein RL308_127 [Bacteroidota bacterium]|jgi:hypothetical protein